MYARVFFLFSLLTAAATANANAIDIPPGDVAALRHAVAEANGLPPGSETLIYANGRFVFSAADALPPITGRIVLIGGFPTVFDGEEGGPERLILIEPSGSLRMTNIALQGFRPESYRPTAEVRGFVEVLGELELHRVQFRSVYNESSCASRILCSDPRFQLYVHESGRIGLDQVSFVDTGTVVLSIDLGSGGLLENRGTARIVNTQVLLTDVATGWIRPFHNAGDMSVVNSSFRQRDATLSPPLAITLVQSEDPLRTTFANTVIGGFAGSHCAQTTSLGHNLVDTAGCDWSAVGDLTGTPTGLVWRPVKSPWPALTHALVPSAASAAVDSADASLCPTTDLAAHPRRYSDGNGDGIAACDRGAVELEPIGLGEGGINGFYYNPQDDGHYVYIQQTDFTTLVMWNTFDPDGNHVWVYGTGELVNGRSVIADAYINRSAGFSPMGIVTDVEAEHWGRLEVDMESCTKGTVAYYSDLPEFGSGQFPVERLAYVKQLGCIDQ